MDSRLCGNYESAFDPDSGIAANEAKFLGVSGDVWANEAPKNLYQFTRFGMAAQLFLGIQKSPIYLKFKSTFRAGNKCKCLDNMLVISENIICRTGSTLPIVSRHAIFEGYDVFFLHQGPTPLFLGDKISVTASRM